jgi:hypothetical protein
VRFQWLQGVLDQSLNAALFALLTMSYVTPPVLTAILLWKRRIWRPNVAAWRWWVWHVGLALGAVSAMAVPIFLLGIQFLSSAAKQRWFIDAGMRGMFYAFVRNEHLRQIPQGCFARVNSPAHEWATDGAKGHLASAGSHPGQNNIFCLYAKAFHPRPRPCQ